MTLPTNYADGNIVHGSDVDTWTTAINANTNALPAGTISGETSTATSAGTTTLTIASPQFQKFTGTTTQTCKLPTTSIVVGNWWLIINASTGTVTVEASGGATVLALPGGTAAFFVSNNTTPTTAAGWDAVMLPTGGGILPITNGGTGVSSLSATPAASSLAEWDANSNLSANNLIQGWTTTASTASGTLTMTVTSTQIQQVTGTHDYIVQLPTTGVVAGMTFYVFNAQASNVVTVNASGGASIVILAANTSAWFTANAATPTIAAGWNSYYNGVSVTGGKNPAIQNSLTLAGTDGDTVTFPSGGGTVVTTTGSQNVSNKNLTTGNTIAASDTLTNNGTISGGTMSPAQFAPTVTTSSAGTLTLSTSDTSYVYTGSSTSTWTLPAVSGNTGTVLFLANRGTGIVTLTSNSGSQIYDASAVASISITPGLAVTVVNDGTYWVVTDSSLTWDTTNQNLTVNNLFEGYTTTATAAGTTTLTVASDPVQVFTGTTTQTVKLPTTSIPQGAQYLVVNQSTGLVTVQSSATNTIVILAAGTSAVFTAAVATPTTAANWGCQYGGTSNISGKLLTVNNTMSFTSVDGATFNFGNTPTTIASASSGIGSTTQVVVASYTIPASTLSAGQAFQLECYGTQNATSGSVTYSICVGTANTSADSVSGTATSINPGVAGPGGAMFEGMLTVRTTGSSGTCIASAIGLGSASMIGTTTATTTINTTVQNFLTLQAKISGAGSHIIQQAFISVKQV